LLLLLLGLDAAAAAAAGAAAAGFWLLLLGALAPPAPCFARQFAIHWRASLTLAGTWWDVKEMTGQSAQQ
jgi:hypothetical protein